MSKQFNPATHLTIRQLARRWCVSTTHVRRLIWRGDLKAVRFGRAIRIPIAEADRFAGELEAAT